MEIREIMRESKKMKLITEMSYDFEITEGKDKAMYAVGIFSSAELLNNNKRMYKKDILEREVEKVQEKIEKNYSTRVEG